MVRFRYEAGFNGKRVGTRRAQRSEVVALMEQAHLFRSGELQELIEGSELPRRRKPTHMTAPGQPSLDGPVGRRQHGPRWIAKRLGVETDDLFVRERPELTVRLAPDPPDQRGRVLEVWEGMTQIKQLRLPDRELEPDVMGLAVEAAPETDLPRGEYSPLIAVGRTTSGLIRPDLDRDRRFAPDIYDPQGSPAVFQAEASVPMGPDDVLRYSLQWTHWHEPEGQTASRITMAEDQTGLFREGYYGPEQPAHPPVADF